MINDDIVLPCGEKIIDNQIVIAIRPLAINDINEHYCAWLNDEEVNRHLESRFTTWNINSLIRYFYDTKKTDIMFAIVDVEQDRHIGNIKITAIDRIHKRAELGIIIGDKTYWGKGVATETIRLATDYCFTTLSLHKVTAGAYAENKASIAAFLKNGFIIEGERKAHFLTQSGWTAAILLGKINPEH